MPFGLIAPIPARGLDATRAPAALAMLAVVLISGSGRASPTAVPAILDPPTQERHPGKVIFELLATPDLGQTESFYTGLFGWSFHAAPSHTLPYATAYIDGQPVGAVVQRPPSADRHAAWLPFFSVPDADAAAKNATAHGGRVLVAPHDVASRGREAVLADPQGAVFAIMASSSGDPPDELKPSGEWIWRSLLTTDPVAVAPFYQAVFGFQTLALPSPAGETHLLLASENYARATVNTLPPGRTAAHPHWLNFVRVDDAAKSAALAERLGGHVLVSPRRDRHGGMIAVIADPLGTPIGLFEWAETETKQVSP